MALIVQSVGTAGRAFSTLAAWEAALPANLVTNGNSYEADCYNDSEFVSASTLLTLSGHTTDATHTITVTTGPGQSFKDNAGKQTNALNYNAANGVGIRFTSNYLAAIVIGDNNVTIRGLQVKGGGAFSSRAIDAGGAGSAVAIDQCILVGQAAAVKLNLGHTLSNSLVLGLASGGTNIVSGVGGTPSATINFCTLVAPSDLATPPAAAILANYGALSVGNTAIFGCAGLTSGSATFTFSACVSDVASPPAGVTGGKAYASQFQNTTTAAGDWRETAGAFLQGAGANTGPNAAADIVGTARPQGSNYDVGCWELLAAGTLVIADSRCPGEFLAAQRSDRGAAVEGVGTQRSGRGIAIEWLGTQRADRTVVREGLGTQRGDVGAAVEQIAGVRAEPAAPAAASATARAHCGMLTEWGGAITVAADAMVPLGWAVSARGDAGANFGNLADVLGAARIVAALCGTIRASARPALEGSAALLRQFGSPAEWLASGGVVVADAPMLLEWLGAPPAPLVSLATLITSPGRVRIVATPGRVRLLRRK